jgi:hypothetical protein
MTEQPELPTDVTVYAVMFVSADRSEVGGGCALYWTHDEAVERLREEIKSQIKGRWEWEYAEYDTKAEADAAFAQEMEDLKNLDEDALRQAYQEDAGDDWIQDMWIEQHTLKRPPDVSSVDKIEQFLEGS